MLYYYTGLRQLGLVGFKIEIMILSPGAKLNLGLYITDKRPDGYHNLLTCFYPIPFSDSLEIVRDSQLELSEINNPEFSWQHKLAPKSSDLSAPVRLKELPITYSSSGLDIKGAMEDNLCIKAYKLLKADFADLPAIQMHLHKVVPMGAGLGGGSADASATLIYLNELGNLGLSQQALLGYAEMLGSDCPGFIKRGPHIGRGKGEILEPIDLPLTGYQLVVVCPGIHVPTKYAFKHVVPAAGPSSAVFSNLLMSGPDNWREALLNQFEQSVFTEFPTIADIKNRLYDNGASYASMSGSGSAVFGLFTKESFKKMGGEEALEATSLGDFEIYSWGL